MGLINFKDLNIEKSKEVATFTFNNQEIMVKKYLSTEDIYDLLMSTLQKSEEEGIYNAYKMDMYFHLNLVYLYTNIAFDLEDRADEPSVYDKLVQSGLLTKVLNRIDKNDYLNYQEWLQKIAEDRIEKEKSIVPFFDAFLNSLPNNLNNILENIDKIQAVVDDNQLVEKIDKTTKMIKIK